MACNDYFQPYIDVLNKNSGGIHGFSFAVGVKGVANRPNQGCYYLDGVFRTYNGTQLIGDGIQYFNDRAPGNNPFNPNAIDQVGLTLTLPDGVTIFFREKHTLGLLRGTMASALYYFKRKRCILKAFLDPALSSVCVDRTASEVALSLSVCFSRKNMVTPISFLRC